MNRKKSKKDFNMFREQIELRTITKYHKMFARGHSKHYIHASTGE